MIGAIVAAVMYYGTTYWLDPITTELKETESVLLEQRAVILQAEANEANEDELLAEANAVRDRLPTEEAVDQIVEMIFLVENQTDVTISQVALSGSEFTNESGLYPTNVESIEYQITLSANQRANVERFLAEIEMIERLVEVTDLEITQNNSEQVEATIILRAFYNQQVIIN